MRHHHRFLLALALVAVAVATGCLQSSPQKAPSGPAPAFSSGNVTPVGFHVWSTCSACPGTTGFEHPTLRLFVAYANGRAALVHWNAEPGNGTIGTAPGVTYAADELAGIFDAAGKRFRPGGEDGGANASTAHVARVETGVLTQDAYRGLVDALTSNWTSPPSGGHTVNITDYRGVGDYGKVRADGTIDVVRDPYHLETAGPEAPDGDATRAFQGVIRAFSAAESNFRSGT